MITDIAQITEGEENMTRVLYFDTETQDLVNFKLPADDPSQPHLVQIAGLLCEADGAEIASMTAIVRPDGWTIPEKTVAIHGITTDMALEHGQPLVDVMSRFAELHDVADIIVAYNIWFDLKVVRGAYRRAALPDRYQRRKEWDAQNAATSACRLPATEKMRQANRGGQWKRPTLAEAYACLIGEPLLKGHDAVEDVRALRRVVLAIRAQQQLKQRDFLRLVSKAG